jgi:hypothetical protein
MGLHDHEERRRDERRVGDSSPESTPGRRTLTDGLPESRTPTGTTAPSVDAATASAPDRSRTDGSLPRLDLGRPQINGTPRALLDDFAREFNIEFAAQLHVFATDDVAPAERGRHMDDRSVTPTESSGTGVPAERLAYLFTQTQIEKLRSFISTRQIPDRLFNGDDVGGPLRANAQQRILLAGHILSEGTYVPGSFAQRLHARMCGHWVTLVNHYAGVAQGGGRGVIENFDHTGGLSLSVSESMAEDGTTEVHGTARTATRLRRDETPDPEARATIQFEGVPLDEYATIQPGDWLWIYNDNGSAGGNHSVIFSRWASDWQYVDASGNRVDEGTRGAIGYRRAITMSQIGPSAGGREEARLLGARRVSVRVGDAAAHAPTISPITRIMHIDPSARPIQRMEDVVALLGSDPRSASRNERFLARIRRGGSFDAARFIAYLRARNEALIVQLAPHMTPLQQRLFRETNTSEHAEHGTIGTLVRLEQRLTNLVHDASALDAGHARRREAVDARHAEADARLAPRRRELENRRAEAEAEIAALDVQRHEAERRVDSLDDVHPRLVAAYRARRARRRPLRDELRHAATEAEQQTIRAELERLDTAVHEAEAEDRETRPELREAVRTVRHLGGAIRRATAREEGFARQLRELEGESGYMLVADGVGRDAFQGREDARVTGLLEDLAPSPTWSEFITPAE